MIKLNFLSTSKSFLQSLFDAFSNQLSNQAIAGSVALAGASLLGSCVKRLFNVMMKRIKETVFSVYIIPKSSPQYLYFMAWLKEQPSIATGVMQVNAGTRASGGPVMRASKMYGIPGSFGQPSSAPPPPLDDQQAQDFTLVPALNSVLSLRYQGCYIWINTGITNGNIETTDDNSLDYPPFGVAGQMRGRGRGQIGRNGRSVEDCESLPSITTIGGNEELVLEILREGKKLISKNAHVTTLIYIAQIRQGVTWELIAERPARKLSSIVLPGDTAAAISKDCSDFLSAEDWYADRGIPYRRGYLLHGKPGCGKTSLVTALAGELKLAVYMLSLATPGLTDATLLDLLNMTPPHVILLMEDIDAVFDVALKNDEKNKKKLEAETDDEQTGEGIIGQLPGGFGSSRDPYRRPKRDMGSKILLSFAGILNAIDGIAAQTGRLLFMTTNYKDKLDSALIRPGRIDYQIEFREATTAQIKDLFFNFYKPVSSGSEPEIESTKCKKERLAAIATEEQRLKLLGQQFSARMPQNKFTMAQVQGMFMRHRHDPEIMLEQLEEELSISDDDEEEDILLPSLSRQLSKNSAK